MSQYFSVFWVHCVVSKEAFGTQPCCSSVLRDLACVSEFNIYLIVLAFPGIRSSEFALIKTRNEQRSEFFNLLCKNHHYSIILSVWSMVLLMCFYVTIAGPVVFSLGKWVWFNKGCIFHPTIRQAQRSRMLVIVWSVCEWLVADGLFFKPFDSSQLKLQTRTPKLIYSHQQPPQNHSGVNHVC